MIGGSSRATLGYYGKLPSAGDFVGRGLPRAVISAWDRWMEQGLPAALQCADGNGALWAFVAAKRTFGDAPMGGVWTMSQDRVGRRFPLMVAVYGCAPAIDDPWFDAAGDALLSAQRATNGQEVLAQALQALGVPSAGPRLSEAASFRQIGASPRPIRFLRTKDLDATALATLFATAVPVAAHLVDSSPPADDGPLMLGEPLAGSADPLAKPPVADDPLALDPWAVGTDNLAEVADDADGLADPGAEEAGLPWPTRDEAEPNEPALPDPPDQTMIAVPGNALADPVDDPLPHDEPLSEDGPTDPSLDLRTNGDQETDEAETAGAASPDDLDVDDLVPPDADHLGQDEDDDLESLLADTGLLEQSDLGLGMDPDDPLSLPPSPEDSGIRPVVRPDLPPPPTTPDPLDLEPAPETGDDRDVGVSDEQMPDPIPSDATDVPWRDSQPTAAASAPPSVASSAPPAATFSAWRAADADMEEAYFAASVPLGPASQSSTEPAPIDDPLADDFAADAIQRDGDERR